MVMAQPFVYMFSESVHVFLIVSFFVRLLFVLLFFCSAHFVRLFSVRLFDYFSVLILKLYSRYFDPHDYNHQAVNKHHTPDSTIFVLV
jgi:hypothetical protein